MLVFCGYTDIGLSRCADIFLMWNNANIGCFTALDIDHSLPILRWIADIVILATAFHIEPVVLCETDKRTCGRTNMTSSPLYIFESFKSGDIATFVNIRFHVNEVHCNNVWAGHFSCGQTTFEGSPSCGQVTILTSLEHCYIGPLMKWDIQLSFSRPFGSNNLRVMVYSGRPLHPSYHTHCPT